MIPYKYYIKNVLSYTIMITTTIRPTSRLVQLNIELPEEYIGQEVTIIMFVEQKKVPIKLTIVSGAEEIKLHDAE